MFGNPKIGGSGVDNRKMTNSRQEVSIQHKPTLEVIDEVNNSEINIRKVNTQGENLSQQNSNMNSGYKKKNPLEMSMENHSFVGKENKPHTNNAEISFNQDNIMKSSLKPTKNAYPEETTKGSHPNQMIRQSLSPKSKEKAVNFEFESPTEVVRNEHGNEVMGRRVARQSHQQSHIVQQSHLTGSGSSLNRMSGDIIRHETSPYNGRIPKEIIRHKKANGEITETIVFGNGEKEDKIIQKANTNYPTIPNTITASSNRQTLHQSNNREVRYSKAQGGTQLSPSPRVEHKVFGSSPSRSRVVGASPGPTRVVGSSPLNSKFVGESPGPLRSRANSPPVVVSGAVQRVVSPKGSVGGRVTSQSPIRSVVTSGNTMSHNTVSQTHLPPVHVSGNQIGSSHIRQASQGIRQQRSSYRQASPGIRQQRSSYRQASPGIIQQGSTIRQNSPGIIQQGSTIRQNSPGIIQQGSTIRQNSPGIIQQGSTIRQNSPGIIQQGSTIRQNSPGIIQQGSTIRQASPGIIQQGSTIRQNSQGIIQQGSTIRQASPGIRQQGSTIRQNSPGIIQQGSTIRQSEIKQTGIKQTGIRSGSQPIRQKLSPARSQIHNIGYSNQGALKTTGTL